MATIMTTTSGIKFYVTPVIDEDWNAGNVMVSLPESERDTVWSIADYLKSGLTTKDTKSGGIVATFKDVYVDEVPTLVNFLNGHN